MRTSKPTAVVRVLFLALAVLFRVPTVAQWPSNPVLAGADPHALVAGDTVWMYPTWNDGTPGERFFAFSSTNLIDWKRHGPVLDFRDVTWIGDDGAPRHHAWAPSVIARNGRWYFYFSVGPQRPTPSRIGVAVGDGPQGPFRDSGRPLLTGGEGFEAIDPMVFADPATDRCLLYVGGSAGARLRVFELESDMVRIAKEIPVATPPQYTEAPFIHHHAGRYHLTYSHGGWRDASYSVHYATATSATGPWEYRGVLLSSDGTRKGPGHHAFLRDPRTGDWLVVYHRWDGQTGDGPYHGSRQICVDRVTYDTDGYLRPITMTGVTPPPTAP